MTAFAEYQALVAKVDDFVAAAHDRQPEAYRCRAGCSGCCQVRLTLLPVEAAWLAAGSGELAEPTRLRIAGQARDAGRAACPYLVDDCCAMYTRRPLICRTQGLPLRREALIDACELNFQHVQPAPASVLDVVRVQALLTTVDARWRARTDRGDERVPIEVIATATAPG
jgi:hypothetical protein